MKEAGKFNMNASAEGVIKFHLTMQPGPPPPADLSAPLRAWFRILRRLELLGQDPDRYLGYAYGNLSRRANRGFIVTCTQTSGQWCLKPADFTLVDGWDLAANRLAARGPCKPSSEALTHAVIHEAIPACRFVFHVHSPEIWQNMATLGLAVTDPAAEYGTPEMAEATIEQLDRLGRPPQGILGMGGHEDGILAWGASAEEAGNLLIGLLGCALTLDEQRFAG